MTIRNATLTVLALVILALLLSNSTRAAREAPPEGFAGERSNSSTTAVRSAPS